MVLDHLELVSTGSLVTKPQAPDEAPDPCPGYGGADPTYDD
jgi:hypothetical protein